MSRCAAPQDVAREMLSWIDLDLISCTKLQTLWAGYGHICAVKARPRQPAATATNGVDKTTQSLILKIISPPHDRGDEGHMRKVFSYEVEQYFYDEIAPTLDRLPLAKCLVSTSNMPQKAATAGFGDLSASILTDLRLEYPVAGEKRAVLTPRQVYSALHWLATFHSSAWKLPKMDFQCLVLPPLEEVKRRQAQGATQRRGLWLNGGYTYLATRRSEYLSLAEDVDSEWSYAFCQSASGTSMSIAELAAAFLTPSGRRFETYLHGDVKSENLFATEMGEQVAFFDFQYAGLGLGVCDLAKLFTCSVPLEMLVASVDLPAQLAMSEEEKSLLNKYRRYLLFGDKIDHSPKYDWDEFMRHWETALVDWCRFQASWGFWGNTRWLQARVRSILQDNEWMEWLKTEVDQMDI